MVLLWMMMMMMMVLVPSESEEMKVKGELGGDVTLTCSFKGPETFWFMEVHNKIRAGLGQTFSSSSSSFFSPDFKSKYLILDHSLVIKNLTAEDFRLYFCGRRTNGTIVFKDVIQVFSDEPVTPTSSSEAPKDEECLKKPALLVSLTLNVVLVSLGLGLTCVYLKKKFYRGKEPAENVPENLEGLQLAPPPVSTDCIYSKIRFT